jgi:hypothetical protein
MARGEATSRQRCCRSRISFDRAEKADPRGRARIEYVRNALGKFTSNDELAFPIAAHLLSARV